MTKNKIHLIFFSLFLMGFAVLNYLPKVLAAESIQRFTQSGTEKEIYNLTDAGVAKSSSGIKADIPIFGFHETFYDITAPSSTFLVGWPLVISTRSSVANNGNPAAGSVFFSTAYPSALGLKQNWGYARTLQANVNCASGYFLISGVNAFNQAVTEQFNFSSAPVVQYMKTPWISISSFTIRISSFNDFLSTCTFLIGTSTGVGLANRIDLSTDVVAVWQQGVRLSSYSIGDISNYTVPIASNALDLSAFNGNVSTRSYVVRDVLYQSRRSIYGD